MSSRDSTSTRAISELNQSGIQDAALAIAALSITQPEREDEAGDDERYANMTVEIMEEYCPLFRVPDEIRTPAESKATDHMLEAILDEAHRMEKEFLACGDPLIQALAAPRPSWEE